MPRKDSNNPLSVISEKSQEEKEIELEVSHATQRPPPVRLAHSALEDEIPEGIQRSTVRPRESRFLSHLESPIIREPGWQQLPPVPIESSFSDDAADGEIDFRTLEWWQAGMST